MLNWIVLDARAHPAQAGFIPGFIREDDPRPLREQINERYVSGWHSMPDFTFDRASLDLSYPGDPVLTALFTVILRDEQLVIYEHGFCLIRKGNEFEVARLD